MAIELNEFSIQKKKFLPLIGKLSLNEKYLPFLCATWSLFNKKTQKIIQIQSLLFLAGLFYSLLQAANQ